jgi:hypothetical protein
VLLTVVAAGLLLMNNEIDTTVQQCAERPESA